MPIHKLEKKISRKGEKALRHNESTTSHLKMRRLERPSTDTEPGTKEGNRQRDVGSFSIRFTYSKDLGLIF